MSSATRPYSLSAVVRRFDGSVIAEELRLPPGPIHRTFRFAGTSWSLDLHEAPAQGGGTRHAARIQLLAGAVANVTLALELTLPEWSVEHYLLVPGIIYAGNRFRVDPQPYPPIFQAPYNLGPDTPPVITDVLRLTHEPGPSQFSLLAGALTVPTIAMFDPARGRSLCVTTDPCGGGRETGYTFIESDDRQSACLRVSSPGIRQPFRYTMGNTRTPSTDRGADLRPGDGLAVTLETRDAPCASVPGLFAQVLDVRYALTGHPPFHNRFPFSAAWDLLEAKYNRDNWNAGDGYYSVGLRENRFQDFQIGWVGGLMSTLPLLHEGDPRSQARARQAVDFVFARGGQGASGFFHGVYHKGEWSGDGFDEHMWTPQARPHPARNHYHLLRRSADALYFLIKQFDLLGRQDPAWRPPPAWSAGTRACADAFVKLWRANGQLGQFADIRTGAIIVGGTSSAGIAPAGLALAARFFAEPAYLAAALEIASFFERAFTDRGLANGGPGEILQGPDSESAAGLLESDIVLWEETGDPRWLAAAEKAAAHLASWQMSYDYRFPPGSVFGRLGMQSTGAVFANAQNGHGAPGLCTLSGDAYLKLYRATGKPVYLQLLHELAHNLTQYLSREDRPIASSDGRPMPSGWMNERVNTSDWDNNLGGVFHGSCWCEVSMMLTCMEVPGVYLRRDTGAVHAFDHVAAEPVFDAGRFVAVVFRNPTPFPARVKVLVDDDVSVRCPLRQNALYGATVCTVPANGFIRVALPELAGI